jgi:hypothetical protein
MASVTSARTGSIGPSRFVVPKAKLVTEPSHDCHRSVIRQRYQTTT